ncbi:MAG: glycoside hydrolase family 2, partial [Chloroflexota bacterium]|nr:glycoside hydrolase family 2 [Chloroflexota bacterium]
IVERDWNHPSIIIWTLVNEDWGTQLMRDPTHRAWLKESYHWLKALDPTRLVVDNSPCEGNFHIQTDIEDYHFYRAIPDHRLEWDYFVNEFAARLAPTFSPFGDAVRSGTEPLILSEFGNWGLPEVELLKDAEGREPWWFETGIEWGEGVVYPHGVRQRFHRWGLDRVFGSWQAFVEATQWQEFAALKYEIESIRRHPQIGGYVITEFTDVHWESNGLLDMRRNPKAFHTAFRTINADTVLIPEWERVAYWSGEPIEVGVTVAHGGGPAIPGGTVAWSLGRGDAAGQLEVPELRPGTARTVGALRLRAPEVDAPTREQLMFRLDGGENERLASNYLPLTFYPQRKLPPVSNAHLWVANPVLAEWLATLGYHLTANPRVADAIVVDKVDYAHADYIREGGHLLLLAHSEGAISGGFFDVQVELRKGTPWSGDWASSFAWLRREGPFARFPGGPLLDYSFSPVMPDHVLVGLWTGLGPWDFESGVYAGLFVGWIHNLAALVATRQYGAGRAVLSTFRINPNLLGRDPVTTLLLDALIELTLAEAGGSSGWA